MIYDELLNETEGLNLIIKEKPLKGYNGRIKGNRIAIKKDLPKVHKACVLAEELGHYYTSDGNILNLKDIRNIKQELRAKAWAYNKQIGLDGIIHAFENRCQTLYDMAEYLNVTEEFLNDALKHYKNKYGISVKIDNYKICFEPNLYIIKYFK